MASTKRTAARVVSLVDKSSSATAADDDDDDGDGDDYDGGDDGDDVSQPTGETAAQDRISNTKL